MVLHFAKLEVLSRVKIFRDGYIRKGGRTQRIKIVIDEQCKIKTSLSLECRYENPSDEQSSVLVMVKESLGVGMGKGLFAITPLKKGTKIIRYTGALYRDKSIQDSLRENYRNEGIVGDYMIETKEFLIDATKEGSDAKFAKHSCDANSRFVEDDRNSKIVHIVAMRNIMEGEEITVEYSIKTDKNDLVPCRFNSKNCRGIKK